MGPLYCEVILTFDLEIMTFILKIISGLLLRYCTWQLLYILWADQTDMVPVHCRYILTF